MHQLVWVDRAGKVIETARGGASRASRRSRCRRTAGASPSPRRRRRREATSGSATWSAASTRGSRSIPGTRSSRAGSARPRLSYVEADESRRAAIFVVNADGSGGKRLLASEFGVGIQHALLAPDGASALRIVDDARSRRLRRAAVLADGTLGPPEEFLRFQPEPDIDEARLSPDGRLRRLRHRRPGPARGVPHALSLGRGPVAGQPGGRAAARAGRRRAGALYYIAGGGPSRRSLVEVKVDPAQDPPVGNIDQAVRHRPAVAALRRDALRRRGRRQPLPDGARGGR